MKRRRLNEDEEIELEEPSTEPVTSVASSKETPSISPSSIQAMVQSEVNKQLSRNKGEQGERASSKPTEVKQSPIKDKKPNYSQEEEKRKEQSLQHSPKKKKKKHTHRKKPTTSLPNRKNKSGKALPPLYNELQPINISPNSLDKLVPFESRQVAELLNDNYCDLSIVSVCSPNRTPEQNMNLSLHLQAELISQDYLYIPLYIVDGGKIEDILFLVFNLGMEPKNTKAFSNFMVILQSKFNIGSYVYLNKGKFYLINNNNKQAFNTNLYSRVIFYYSSLKGIQVSNQRKLYVNPEPVSNQEYHYRYQVRKEVCIHSLKKEISRN